MVYGEGEETLCELVRVLGQERVDVEVAWRGPLAGPGAADPGLDADQQGVRDARRTAPAERTAQPRFPSRPGAPRSAARAQPSPRRVAVSIQQPYRPRRSPLEDPAGERVVRGEDVGEDAHAASPTEAAPSVEGRPDGRAGAAETSWKARKCRAPSAAVRLDAEGEEGDEGQERARARLAATRIASGAPATTARTVSA